MPVHRVAGLVEEIELSRYASGIYEKASSHDLRIVRFAEANLANDAHLRVSPRIATEFRHVDTHSSFASPRMTTRSHASLAFFSNCIGSAVIRQIRNDHATHYVRSRGGNGPGG